MVSDTRIQKLDAIGAYYYQIVMSPVVNRIRYANISYTKLLIASTIADATSIVTGV